MIISMTGFGKASANISFGRINVEIRCLNGKQLDFRSKMPGLFQTLEPQIRQLIAKFQRGSVDLQLSFEKDNQAPQLSFNHKLALSYLHELQDFSERYKLKTQPDFLQIITRMPDVVSSPDISLTENDIILCLEATERAIQEAILYRTEEGKGIQKELMLRVEKISQGLQKVKTLEPKRTDAIRKRLKDLLNNSAISENTDANRLEQEVLFFVDRNDISEEMQRLASHCSFFIKSMDVEGSGKKLGFIAQEMGREINTIGSKANDAEIQHEVVFMKEELEKIKEQLMNVL